MIFIFRFDSFSTIITVDGKSISLGLWDTAGEIENRNVRAFQYPQTVSVF